MYDYYCNQVRIAEVLAFSLGGNQEQKQKTYREITIGISSPRACIGFNLTDKYHINVSP